MKKILTIAAAAVVLAACSKSEGGSSDLMRVTIDPTITRATEVDFEDKDEIGLTITTSKETFADNVKFVFDGANKVFTADAGMLWYEDVNEKSTLFAYYPYSAANASEFTVAADQNGDGYGASDFMSASKTGVLPTKNAVNMTFRHKMARLILNVTNETDFKVSKIVVKNTVGTAVIDAEANAIAAKTDGAALDITARQVTEDQKYYALVVPQSAKIQVAVTTAEGERSQGFTETLLESGKSYELSVRVMPKEMTVSISGPIDAWEDGGEIPSEGQQGGTDTSVEYGGVKYETVAMKDGRVWMASNLRYVPEGKTVEEDFTKHTDGIWYPLTASYDDAASKYVGVVSKDDGVVAANGYLYTFATAVGVSEITEDNSATFEGARGICPEGWHIPSQAEWTALLAAYPSAAASKSDLADLEAAGFSCPLTGMRMRNNSGAAGSISGNCFEDHIMAGYMMSSTKNTFTVKEGVITNQNKVFMLMHNAANRNAQISNSSNFAGIPVRCIKDKQ